MLYSPIKHKPNLHSLNDEYLPAYNPPKTNLTPRISPEIMGKYSVKRHIVKSVHSQARYS